MVALSSRACANREGYGELAFQSFERFGFVAHATRHACSSGVMKAACLRRIP